MSTGSQHPLTPKGLFQYPEMCVYLSTATASSLEFLLMFVCAPHIPEAVQRLYNLIPSVGKGGLDQSR